jgi:hypothetical protein
VGLLAQGGADKTNDGGPIRENADDIGTAPDVVVASKPELYDTSGAVRGYVDDHGLVESREFLAFEASRVEPR